MRSILDEPFHEGERAVQRRMGVRERLAQIGPRLMRPFLTDQHREFFEALDFVVLGVLDADGRPRASVVAGGGTSPDPTTLRLARLPAVGDPVRDALVPGAPIGVLGLQPHTRRRNRVNGRVTAVDDAGVLLEVHQTFGNCPKFIRSRTVTTRAIDASPVATRSSALSPADVAWIRGSDTFFIASAHSRAGDDVAAHGVDVSHRGGGPGFVGVDGDELWVPDFAGNFYFNTLGNLVQHPRAGLVFLDAEGSLLQIAVDVEIVWDGPEVDAFPGAERFLKMRVVEVVRIEHAVPLHFDEGDASPFAAPTGAFPG
jgi:predicted pyridoxine 5'-phosphate oxidase superfamily flavin-nucleotide-binding protein